MKCAIKSCTVNRELRKVKELRAVGGLDDIVDLQSFTGVSFKVPIIDRYSPIAISLAYHLHFDVVKHRGAETTHRLSLQYVKILGGRALSKLIRDECIFCRKILLKIKIFRGHYSTERDG